MQHVEDSSSPLDDPFRSTGDGVCYEKMLTKAKVRAMSMPIRLRDSALFAIIMRLLEASAPSHMYSSLLKAVRPSLVS